MITPSQRPDTRKAPQTARAPAPAPVARQQRPDRRGVAALRWGRRPLPPLARFVQKQTRNCNWLGKCCRKTLLCAASFRTVRHKNRCNNCRKKHTIVRMCPLAPSPSRYPHSTSIFAAGNRIGRIQERGAPGGGCEGSGRDQPPRVGAHTLPPPPRHPRVPCIPDVPPSGMIRAGGTRTPLGGGRRWGRRPRVTSGPRGRGRCIGGDPDRKKTEWGERGEQTVSG